MLKIKLAWRMISKSQNKSILRCAVFIPRTLRADFKGEMNWKGNYQSRLSCTPRLDASEHFPPGIFHTRYIAADQKKCRLMFGFPNSKWNKYKADKKESSITKRAQQNTGAADCAIPERSEPRTVHPSIHPSGAASVSGYPVRTISHSWSCH